VLKKNLNKNHFFFEYIYYYYYLLNNSTFLHIKKLIFFKKKVNLFFTKHYFFTNNIDLIKKLDNKFNNFKINYNLNISYNLKDNLKDNWDSISNEKITKTTPYLQKNEKIKYLLFNIFFLFSYSMFNSKFKKNHLYGFFHVINKKNKLIIFNLNKFILRWKNAYDLLLNVFYYNFKYLILSTPLFKKQTLSLNWNYSTWTVDLWKFYSPFFIFQPTRYSKKIDFFFKKLKAINIKFFITTDSVYHYKNLFYLKSNDCYTIGLINLNDNPWLVSYPIISFYDSYLIQLFFFKLITYIRRQSLFLKYIYYRKIWYQNTTNFLMQ